MENYFNILTKEVVCRNSFSLILLGFLLIFQSSIGYSQEYGLGFAGQPYSKDRRTQLDLNPGKYFSFNGQFELSFEIRMRSENHMTFGYVFRIIDTDNRNVDLIFNGTKSSSLQVVYSNNLTDISVPYRDSGIYKDWTKISLKFNLNEETLEFKTSDTTLLESGLKLNGKMKILFGRNFFAPFQTTDVATMDIRDIKIFKKKKCLYYFPLDEDEGNVATDLISKKKASVQNALWIRPTYHNWEEHFATILSGFATICFDPHKENLYMVGDKQLKIFSVVADSIETIDYSSEFTELITGSQVFYDASKERLICYNVRSRIINYFNFSNKRWEEISDTTNNEDRFWFHNKYFSNQDSVLYIFGGYSQHRYSNMVLEYDFKTHLWDTLKTNNDVFLPRMHAAIGALDSTIYILGGFGSTSGDQILNPHHYDDLLAFSLKEKKFIKIFNFKSPTKDIDFAHSMVIDTSDNSFYVLASSIYQFNSFLQLLKGSFSKPELQLMSEKIPYLFHNVNSYADLFFSRSLQQLIAVSLLANTDKNETKISVYTNSFPPHPSKPNIINKKGFSRGPVWILLISIVGITVLFFSIRWYFLNKRKKIKTASDIDKREINKNTKEEFSKSDERHEKRVNSILFFGGFQIINRDGVDITRRFTPLLKELFLLIFLYSVKYKGISVIRLTELLWFSMDAKSAKNNRAVNIAKLKHLLTEIDSCDLTRKTGYWQIVFDDSKVYCDYWMCDKLTSEADSLTKQELEKLLCTIKPGSLLENANYEWLDEFKLECSNDITDVLIKFVEQKDISKEPELMIRIADAILIFDIMHEEAISIKCIALTVMGKHNLAKEIFNKFVKDYLSLYDEPYNKAFTDIIKQ